MNNDANEGRNQLIFAVSDNGPADIQSVKRNSRCGTTCDNRAKPSWGLRSAMKLGCVALLCGLPGANLLRPQCAQTDYSPDLQNRLQTLLSQFLACSPDDPQSACNVFVAKALKAAYGIDDFIQTDPASGTKTYLTADMIALNVKTDARWVDLGPANSQGSLDAAQQAANCGRAVIATEFNPTGSGHVALILPGVESASGNWGLNVPNSASFFVDKPDKAYIGKGLSYAFSSADGIEIYARATP
jgi:hypothetical protein